MAWIPRLIRLFKRILQGQDPLVIRQSPEKWNAQFAKGTWDRLALNQPNTICIGDYILARVRESASLRILDVGCGNGGLYKYLTSEPRISYLGTDLSEVAVKRAQNEYPNAVFVVGDAEKPAKDLGVFDVIVFNEMLYYTNIRAVLTAHINHAKPDTHVLISMYDSWRSYIMWMHVRRYVEIHTLKHVHDKQTGTRWTIAFGTFKPSQSS